jgi:hypothetical protein
MAEYCGWLFIDNIPLVYEKKRVARQLQVETWLQLAEFVKELKMLEINLRKRSPSPAYTA